MGTSKVWSYGFLFAILIASLFKSGKSITLAVTHANGSLTLPDPSAINSFLKLNTNLTNPLLQGHPPLQLQLCNSSIYASSVDFYTLELSQGCEKPPKGLKSRKFHSKNMPRLELAILVSAGVTSAFLVGWGLARLLSTRFRKAVSPMPLFLDFPLDPDKWCGRNCQCLVLSLWWIGMSVIGGGGPFLYLTWIGAASLNPAPLPDPGFLNHFLTSSGQNVTLSLCTVKKVFQVYLGFSDGCDQVQNFLYPGMDKQLQKASSLGPFVHGAGQTFLLTICTMWTLAAWLYLAVWGIHQGVGGLYLCCFYRRKVYDVEDISL